MTIAIGCDSWGIWLKDRIVAHLKERGFDVADVGGYEGQPKRRYYEAAADVAHLIQTGRAEKGILLCGTGMGVAIVANKFKGIYAAVVESEFAALKAKQINNANVLAFGPMMISEWRAKLAVDAWLDARHTDAAATPEVAEFLKYSMQMIRGIEEENFR
ncbi:MAG: RpiB/LacA/LacB family sugar-phosphate isomerase [Oscillospiraceae bacterium]|nr:RpiB/LacA/LacB family sugar-phosphate isomerase [Oscillospiraceae bacterium]